jgi:hypothetical protein
MTHPAASFYQPVKPQLLAERTRDVRNERACCLCSRPLVRGVDRIADVVAGRGPAHLGCIGQLPPGEAQCR